MRCKIFSFLFVLALSLTQYLKGGNIEEVSLIIGASRLQHGVIGDSYVRIYENHLTEQEIQDITYIVTTLANKSIAKILFYKSSLDKAGDRVEHVHPLRFLECVFTREPLKAGIRAIKKKGWVWKDFMAGLGNSMKEEYLRGNLNEDQVRDFSGIVGVDPKLIYPSIVSKNWKKIVDQLIKHIPREGDYDRYDF